MGTTTIPVPSSTDLASSTVTVSTTTSAVIFETGAFTAKALDESWDPTAFNVTLAPHTD